MGHHANTLATAPASGVTTGKRLWLAGEFLLVMFVLPTACVLKLWPYNPLILGIIVGAVACIWLWRQPTFPRADLYRFPSPKRNLLHILALFLVAGTLLTILATLLLPPDQRFHLPRTHFRIWLHILILYPLISVYPQELFYRAFFFERYRPLFRSPASLLLSSTLAFAYAHVVFRNWQAPVLTIAGGLIFGYRYYLTRSLLLVTIEHALWGLLVLTIGLERNFLTVTSFLLK